VLKKNISFSIFLSFLLLLFVSVPAWAEANKTQTEQKNTFDLEIAHNLINLQAKSEQL